MKSYDLLSLVEKAQSGDKNAMTQIIQMFEPLIMNVLRKSHLNDRGDLRQHLTEKIIRAVLHYDLSIVPEYSKIIEQFLNKDV